MSSIRGSDVSSSRFLRNYYRFELSWILADCAYELIMRQDLEAFCGVFGFWLRLHFHPELTGATLLLPGIRSVCHYRSSSRIRLYGHNLPEAEVSLRRHGLTAVWWMFSMLGILGMGPDRSIEQTSERSLDDDLSAIRAAAHGVRTASPSILDAARHQIVGLLVDFTT